LIVGESRKGYRVLERKDDRGCPIGLVLPGDAENWDPFDQRMIGALQKEAARRGRMVLAIGMGKRGAEEVTGELVKARASAVLVNAPDGGLLECLQRAGLPTVLIGTWDGGGRNDSVAQDSFAGAMAAAMHLASRGHARIGWLGYEVRGNTVQVAERFGGAVGGLASVGLRLNEDACLSAPENDVEAAADAAGRLLRLPERPTGILALWQPLAAGLVRAAARMGIVPGRDFEMVGWINGEAYASEYLPLFGGGPPQPAVVWSLGELIGIALARAEERRANPDLPPARLKIPAILRLAP
ncbi:MAG: substrate-binding domain-containing protein, partial [Planctomycetota bacterium]|nr:substrate-binding domain-containing protein [Planctomycetota bacterium]